MYDAKDEEIATAAAITFPHHKSLSNTISYSNIFEDSDKTVKYFSQADKD